MKGSWTYTSVSLKLLNIFSFNTWKILLPLILIASAGCSLIAVTLQFPKITNLLNFSIELQAVCAFLQLFFKLTYTIMYREELVDLLQQTEMFWNTEMCNDAQENLNKILGYVLLLQTLFFGCVSFGISALIICSFIFNRLAAGVWIGDRDLLYRLVQINEGVAIVHSLFVIWFDAVFVMFCVHLRVQFMILSHCFSRLDPNEAGYKNKMGRYVEYHNFLLRFLQNLQEFYSPVSFIQCATIIFFNCTNLYVLTETKSNYNVLFTFSLLLFQMMLYCIPVEMVVDGVAMINDGIYESLWYTADNFSHRNTLTIIIHRSQQPFVFKSLGIMEIGVKTICNVLMLSWSYFTMMSFKQ